MKVVVFKNAYRLANVKHAISAMKCWAGGIVEVAEEEKYCVKSERNVQNVPEDVITQRSSSSTSQAIHFRLCAFRSGFISLVLVNHTRRDKSVPTLRDIRYSSCDRTVRDRREVRLGMGVVSLQNAKVRLKFIDSVKARKNGAKFSHIP